MFFYEVFVFTCLEVTLSHAREWLYLDKYDSFFL